MAQITGFSPFAEDGDDVDIVVAPMAETPGLTVTIQPVDDQQNPTGPEAPVDHEVRYTPAQPGTVVLHISNIAGWETQLRRFTFVVFDQNGSSSSSITFAPPPGGGGGGGGGGNPDESQDGTVIRVGSLDVTPWITNLGSGLWASVGRLALNVAVPGRTRLLAVNAPYQPAPFQLELTVDGEPNGDLPSQAGLTPKRISSWRRQQIERELNRTEVLVSMQRWVGVDALGRPGTLVARCQPQGPVVWAPVADGVAELLMRTQITLLPIDGSWREAGPSVQTLTNTTAVLGHVGRGTMDVEDAIVTFQSAGSIACPETGTKVTCTRGGVTLEMGSMVLSGASWAERVIDWSGNTIPLLLRPGAPVVVTGTVQISATPAYREP